MKLLVGLGNPGSKYSNNRHNVGFMALDRIAEVNGLGRWRTRFHSFALEGELGGERVLLIKPQTYYNDTGNAVREAAKFLKIKIFDIIVFHDEIDLAPGKLRIKTGGGLAGNNGLRSMQAQLSSPDFTRVRIGVGHPGDKNKVAGYVLQDFSKADLGWLDVMLDAIAGSAGRLAAGETERFQTDVAQAMANLHKPDNGETAKAVQNKGAQHSSSGRPPAASSAKKPPAKSPAQKPAGARKPGERGGAPRPGGSPSQLHLAQLQSVKADAEKRRKASRKIKKGVQSEDGDASPTAAKESETVELAANPLAARLKRWFSGETNNS